MVSVRVLVGRVGSADLCGVRRYLPITGASPQSGIGAGREVLLGYRCSKSQCSGALDNTDSRGRWIAGVHAQMCFP